MRDLAFVVPGPIDQLTGGYLFDRLIVEGLRASGRKVEVVELAGRYPDVDKAALEAAAGALSSLPSGASAVIDGLALPAFKDCLAQEAGRLKLVGFIHHPLALETGLTEAESRRFAEIEGRLTRLLRGILCPSHRTAEAVAAYGVGKARIAVTPPGTEKPPVRARRQQAPGALHLLTVGTITPRKGHLLLIEALARLKSRNWRLICIGSLDRHPETTAALIEAIARHGLGEQVDLWGERPPESLSEAYRDADLFVLPSYHEGYGMAFAEALAHGLPIVATTAGAIPDTVPAEAGLLVPPGDVTALAEALGRLFEDGGLRDRLAAGARRAGAALPDWQEATRLWADAFDRLVA